MPHRPRLRLVSLALCAAIVSGCPDSGGGGATVDAGGTGEPRRDAGPPDAAGGGMPTGGTPTGGTGGEPTGGTGGTPTGGTGGTPTGGTGGEPSGGAQFGGAGGTPTGGTGGTPTGGTGGEPSGGVQIGGNGGAPVGGTPTEGTGGEPLGECHAESCNGLDDDCDGLIDEDADAAPLTESCYRGPLGTEGVGVCRAGQAQCTQGAFGPCIGESLPGQEICDSADNDCNGASDDVAGGCGCMPGLGRGCFSGPPGTADVGVCRSGRQFCDPDGRGYGPCFDEILPTGELCDGRDDDCDGAADEDFGAGEACETGVGACRAGGVLQCAAGGAVICSATPTLPSAEVCNAVDDDCDGIVDDGELCGLREVCQAGACQAGPPGRFMLCGTSDRDVAGFLAPADDYVLEAGCRPDAGTRTLLVSRSGPLGADAQGWRAFLEQGGNIVTERTNSDEIFNAVLGAQVAEGVPVGACVDNVNPAVRHTPDDRFWIAHADLSLQAPAETGCGNALEHFPGITPLGGPDPTHVTLAYIDVGFGRLWLVDQDWQDLDAVPGAWNDASRALMRDMILWDGRPHEGSLRLSGAVVPTEGRVEVYHAGAWGTVCDPGFDAAAAEVACRQTGFRGAAAALPGYGGGVGPIWLGELGCAGPEARLVDCAHGAIRAQPCDHLQDAGVRCLTGSGDVGADCGNDTHCLAPFVCAGGVCREPPRCGDGHVDPPEMCDDGNDVDADGCSTMCVDERMDALVPGVRHNVGSAELTARAWVECYSQAYSEGGAPLQVILNACQGDLLMMGCRYAGMINPPLIVAAEGLYSEVTRNVGNGADAVNTHNDVDFYFSGNASWGFAPGGLGVTRSTCDQDVERAEDRMCWHTSGDTFTPGWSCGLDRGLGGLAGAGFERVLYRRTLPQRRGRTELMVCGQSQRDPATFLDQGDGLQVVAGCAPTALTHTLLVTRTGAGSVGANAVGLRTFVEGGGLVITESGSSDEVYNAVFQTNVVQGSPNGLCTDEINPRSRDSLGDPFWADAARTPFPAANATGCGMDMAGWAQPLVRLGGWSAGTTSLAYRDAGLGRVWLVETDWQDGDAGFGFVARKMMHHMVFNGWRLPAP